MAQSEIPSQAKVGEPRTDNLLDSWKEIAAYLGREVRTVQRWEKKEGLPVHRRLHEKLGSVYAYKSEIDNWWHERSSTLAGEHVEGPRTTRKRLPILSWPAKTQQFPIETPTEGIPRRSLSLTKPHLNRTGLWLITALVVALSLAFGFNWRGLRDRLGARGIDPQIRSLAVLPLENLTGDPSQDYFADGMTDALITDLAQIGSLRVVSRTSSMQYRRTPKSLPQIGRELKVDVVVEGTVARSGDRVRIDAQLIRAETDQHLWARSYEGSLDHILALQGEVAEAISNEVRAKLTPEERARLANQHSPTPEAYEFYLRGNHFLDKRTRADMEKALEYYQQATQKDPSFAWAFAGLADTYSLLSGFGFLPEKDAVPKGKAAAEKAVSLDGSSAEALTALAAFTDDPREVEKLFRRAIEINPGYALAHHWYARFLSNKSRFDEALVEIRRARSLDPLSVRIVDNEGEILFLAGHPDKALERFQLALDMDSSFPVTHWNLGRSYEFLGRYREAISEFQRTDLLNGMNPVEASARAAALNSALATSGQQGYWRKWIALRMKDREKSPHAYAYNIAYDYAHLGDNASAVAWLETCLQEKSCAPIYVQTDPGLDGLRSDPGYQSLLARMGLPK